MSKFEKGDLVRCVDNTGGYEGLLTVGKVYEVLATYWHREDDCVEFTRDTGSRASALASRFELAKADHPVGQPASDPVFRPHHYARFVIEPLTFINANKLPANIANVVKYVCRYDAKNGREDLLKARRYIDIQLECMDRDERVGNGEDPATVWSVCL